MSPHPKPPPTEIDSALSVDEWLKRATDLLEQLGQNNDSGRADDLTPEQVMAKLRALAPGATASINLPIVVSERTARGYKVRCTAPLLTEEERKARQNVALQAMAQALKKLRP